MIRSASLAFGLVVIVASVGCETAPAKPDASPTAPAIQPVPKKPEEKKPEAPPPKKEEPKVEEKKPEPTPVAKDAIDDENWLPASGSGRDAFLAAVQTARTDPAAAVPRFVEAAGKTKNFYAAWYNAGAAAEGAGDLSMAEKYYRQALATRPDYGPAMANLAVLLDKTGRGAEAQRTVEDAVKKMPEKAGPHLAAATLAWARKDTTTVNTEALAAIKYDERNVPAMLLMARIFRLQGRQDTARFALENALAVEPGNALLHLEFGQVQLELQDEKAALVSFEKAARLRPTLLEAQDNYGVLLLKQGLAAEAVKAFQEAARLDPKSARAQLHLGNGLRATKQYPQAEEAYKKALAVDPTLAEAHFNLGVLYIDNPLPNVDEVARLQQGLAELKQFKTAGKPEAAVLARVDDYIDATDKRIQKEIKRRERDAKRKKEDAADAAKKPPEGAGNPAAGGAVPATAADAPKGDAKPEKSDTSGKGGGGDKPK